MPIATVQSELVMWNTGNCWRATCWDPRWNQQPHSGYFTKYKDTQHGENRRAPCCSLRQLEVVSDPQFDYNATSWLAGHPIQFGEAFLKGQGCYFSSRTVAESNHRPFPIVLCRILPRASRERLAMCTTLTCTSMKSKTLEYDTWGTGGRSTLPWEWGWHWPASNACHVFQRQRTGHHDRGWTGQSRQVVSYLLQKGAALSFWTPSKLSSGFAPESGFSSSVDTHLLEAPRTCTIKHWHDLTFLWFKKTVRQ